MGNEVSREAQAAHAIIDLRKDDSKWRSVVEHFNTVVPHDYDAPFDDKRAIQIVMDQLSKQLQNKSSDPAGIVHLLEAARRMLRSKGLYKALQKMSVLPFIQALNHSASNVVEAALSCMRNIVEFVGKTKREESRQNMEAVLREMTGNEGGYETLADLIKRFGRTNKYLILAKTLNIFSIVLLTKARSTQIEAVIRILNLLRPHAEFILRMSSSENPDVCYYSIITTQALIFHSGPQFTKRIQDLALQNGALLLHFYTSALGKEALRETTANTKNAEAIVLESRNLVGLLTDGHPIATSTLQRCIPNHFMKRLLEKHPYHVSFVFTKPGKDAKGAAQDATWMRYKKGLHRANWLALFDDLEKDHLLPHVWWNDQTRYELITSLKHEIDDLRVAQSKSSKATWDYDGFDVVYTGVQSELQVHGYYLRMLLPVLLDPHSSYKINTKEVPSLVHALYDRAVIEDKPTWKLACLRTMHALYNRYAQVIADFGPLPYLVWLVSPEHARPAWRDQILAFLHDLLKHQPNARRFVQAGALDHLVYYMCQAHRPDADAFLHKHVHERHPSYIGASINDESADDAADILTQIPPALTIQELASTCTALVNLLLQKLPRLSKSITKMTAFRNAMQMLLVDDDEIRKAIPPIILHVSEANPTFGVNLSSLGIFYFLIYAMKNECSQEIAQICESYHNTQVYYTDEGEVPVGSSVLATLFPSPVIRALEVHGASYFQDIINGTFRQPDVIWGPTLKSHLIERIEEFLQPTLTKLKAEPLALYEYVDPPQIVYAELEDEICLGDTYLKCFVETPDFQLYAPSYTMAGIVGGMTLPLKPSDEELVLQSQLILANSYPDLPECTAYQAFPELLAMMSRKLVDGSIDNTRIVSLSAQLLHRLLTLSSNNNRSTALESGAVQAYCDALLHTIGSKLPIERRDELLLSLLKSANILIPKNEGALTVMNRSQETLIQLVKLISFQNAEERSQVSYQVTELLKHFADLSETRYALLSSGAVLSLLRLAIYLPIENPCVAGAAAALSSLYVYRNEPEIDKEVTRISRGLVTPGLCAELTDREHFVDMSRDTTVSPVLIWGDEQRKELLSYLEKEQAGVAQLGSWTNFPENKFAFSFDSLSAETVVDDIYLRLYNENKSYALRSDPERFLIALSDSVRIKSQTLAISESGAQAVFDHVKICSVSIARLINSHPELMHSEARAYTIDTLTALYQSQNPDMIQAALHVLDQVVAQPASLPIARHFAFMLHRFLNIPRDSVTANPNIHILLRIMNELCTQDSETVSGYFDNGLVISVLAIFADKAKSTAEQRMEAAHLLGVLSRDARKGENYVDVLSHILAPTFHDKLLEAQMSPQELISFYDDDHDTPLVFWTEDCRKDLKKFIKEELNDIRVQQQAALDDMSIQAPYKWAWETVRERFVPPTLGAQIRIDGIYVHAFNANPYFQVKPDRFFAKLMDALYESFAEYAELAVEENVPQLPQLIQNLLALWEAVYNLLVNLPHLQDRCVDYLDYLFSYFQEAVDPALQDSALKTVALLATNSVNAENIAKFRLLKNIFPLITSPSFSHLNFGQRVLDILMDVIRRSSPAVNQIRSSGGIVLLLDIILSQSKDTEQREKAAMITSAMIQDNVYGASVADYMVHILTEKFRSIFQARPARFISFIGEDHESESDGRTWNETTRSKLKDLIKQESLSLAERMFEWDGTTDLWDSDCIHEVWPRPVESLPEESEGAQEDSAVPQPSDAAEPEINNDLTHDD